MYLRELYTFFKGDDGTSYFLLADPYEIVYNAFLLNIILPRAIYTIQSSCSSSALLKMFFSMLEAVWVVSRDWTLYAMLLWPSLSPGVHVDIYFGWIHRSGIAEP